LKSETRNFLRYWLPAILWTAVVFIASSDMFSAEHTGSVLEFVLTKVYGPIPPDRFAFIHFLTRKTAHVTEYGILAWFYFRAWRDAHPADWRMLWTRRAWAVCIAVAATDEFHQSFVASRTSSPWDVALDAAGAAVVLAMVWLHWRWTSPQREQRSAST
jgi:VanZ family protein